MDEFGFPPLEVEQATMVIANITDPIDIPWNTDNLFTRLITLKSIRRREERIIKRLKGKGMFGEVPFMLRLQTSRHLLDSEMTQFMQSSVPQFFHPVDYAEIPRIRPLSVSASDFIDQQIQRTSPQLMGGFIPARSLAVTDLHNLEEVFDYGRPATEIPMPDREGATSAATECQRYGMANGCDEYCPVLRAGLCEFQDSDNAALYAAAVSNNVN